MWPNPQETANLVTFTEEILNEKLAFFVQYLLVSHSRKQFIIITIIITSKSLHLEQRWKTNKYCCIAAQSIFDNMKIYIDMDGVI